MPRKKHRYLNLFNTILLIQIVLIIFGLKKFLDPYFLVSSYSVVIESVAGDPSGNPTLLSFTLESNGLLTSNYPIDVKTKFYVGSDWEEEFRNASNIEVWISDSYAYPINVSSTGFIPTGSIRISSSTREGAGTVIFPYDGEYSIYVIVLDGKPFYMANFPTPKEKTLFKILDYSTRASMENNNKNLGIAIISISLTILGLVYNSRKES